eukprot:4645563-Prymnesium_polylepis.1
MCIRDSMRAVPARARMRRPRRVSRAANTRAANTHRHGPAPSVNGTPALRPLPAMRARPSTAPPARPHRRRGNRRATCK